MRGGPFGRAHDPNSFVRVYPPHAMGKYVAKGDQLCRFAHQIRNHFVIKPDLADHCQSRHHLYLVRQAILADGQATLWLPEAEETCNETLRHDLQVGVRGD